MVYVNDVINILENEFPTSWDEIIKIKSDEQVVDYDLSLLSNKISTTFEKIIFNLNLSIITGEYLHILNLEDIKTKITSKLDKIINEIATEYHESESFQLVTYDLIYGLREPIIIALNNYHGLFKEMKKRYSNPEKSSLFTSILHEKFSISQKIDIDQVKKLLHEFIEYNIPLAKIDHALAVKPNQLEEALTIKYSIEKSITESTNKDKIIVLKILNDKCDYLGWKILTRYEKDPFNYFYALDYEDKQLEVSQFEPKMYSEFGKLSKTLYIHPNQLEHKNKFEEHIKSLKKKRKCNTKLNFKETFALIKDLKDNPQTGLNEIDKVITNFKEQNKTLLQSNYSFNNWAYEASCSYLHNNQLSAKLKCKILSTSDIENEFVDLNKIQYESDQKNYFPYLKLCQHVIKHILPKHYKSGNIKDFSDSMGLLEKIEKALYESFEWCSDRNFIPFQLPYKESLIPYESGEFKCNLFLASSFILPINFEKVENEIKKISREKEKYQNMIDMFSSIQIQKTEIDRIKEGIEKTDKRHIEILSIFAAIVLFTSSSIQVFAKAANFIDALRFMLVFGYVLVLFIFLIWLITRENGVHDMKLPKFHIRLLYGLVTSTVIALLLIITSPNQEKSDTKPAETKPILNRIIDFCYDIPSYIYEPNNSIQSEETNDQELENVTDKTDEKKEKDILPVPS